MSERMTKLWRIITSKTLWLLWLSKWPFTIRWPLRPRERIQNLLSFYKVSIRLLVGVITVIENMSELMSYSENDFIRNFLASKKRNLDNIFYATVQPYESADCNFLPSTMFEIRIVRIVSGMSH